MTNFKQKVLFIFTLSIILISCVNTKSTKQNSDDCLNTIEGTLVDMTGLDGCGWMIKLKDDKKVNPTNLKSFNIELAHNKKVAFNYIKKNDLFGICIAGQIVEIKCIQDHIKGN